MEPADPVGIVVGVGLEVLGLLVGCPVGIVLGVLVGCPVGLPVGRYEPVGRIDVVGVADGAPDGPWDCMRALH